MVFVVVYCRRFVFFLAVFFVMVFVVVFFFVACFFLAVFFVVVLLLLVFLAVFWVVFFFVACFFLVIFDGFFGRSLVFGLILALMMWVFGRCSSRMSRMRMNPAASRLSMIMSHGEFILKLKRMMLRNPIANARRVRKSVFFLRLMRKSAMIAKKKVANACSMIVSVLKLIINDASA